MKSALLLGAVLSIWVASGCGKEEVAAPPPVGGPLSPEALAHAEWEWHRLSLDRYPIVSGRVFGPDGDAFEGATATLCIFPPVPVQLPKRDRSVTSDAAGLFVFEDVPANARIVVEGPDLISVMLPAWMLVRKGVDAVEVRLRRGGSVEGVLRTSTNEPLPAYPVWARASDPDWYDAVVTDDDGRYRFPKVPPGQVVVGALRRGKLGGVDRPVTVREGLTATADLVARELPPVVGRVVDLKTGDPVPKALIVFVTDREHIIATDEEGRFRIEGDCLPSFVVRADGYAESTLFVDPERAEEQPVLARLIPGGRIYGRVVDEAGNPVASARIRALVDPERVAATIPGPLTDEEGRFAFTWVRLPPNGAQVVVLAEGAEMNPAAADAVHLLPGGAIEHVTLTLMKPIEVSLRLVDERGVSWPRAEVNLEWREGPPPGPVHDFVAANPRSFSDGEGRVRVTGLRRGLHKLIVGAHRRLPWSTDVRIEGRPGEDLGDVLLPRGLALAGRVESTGGEEVPQGTTLHLAGRAGQSLSIDIEPDGSFLFEGFEPGNYVLRGEAPAHES
ncbi:MAG: carboxypeptidase regulatory-like domain-containing protein, partial [Planctomycetota bacterium]